MSPTLRGDGDEIVLLDRFTPRWLGLQGGDVGSQRATEAIQFQREFWKPQQQYRSASMSMTSREIWYEPKFPANTLPRKGIIERCRGLWTQCTTPITVGDVVVLEHPDRIGTVCKRILGLPGDVVSTPRSEMGASQMLCKLSPPEIVQEWNPPSEHQTEDFGTFHKGSMFLPITPYQTNIVALQRQKRSTTVIVPDGHVWVEGDNPQNSNDSRNYGPVPASLIVGRVVCRLWPIDLRYSALMERGDRPIEFCKVIDSHNRKQTYSPFSGSIVFPAGYRNEIIIRDHEQWRQILKNLNYTNGPHTKRSTSSKANTSNNSTAVLVQHDSKSSIATAEPKE